MAGSRIVATEFCATSITSAGFNVNQQAQFVAANPHLRYGNSALRGYTLLELGAQRLEAKQRVIGDLKKVDTGVSTDATFVVEAGRPGVAR